VGDGLGVGGKLGSADGLLAATTIAVVTVAATVVAIVETAVTVPCAAVPTAAEAPETPALEEMPDANDEADVEDVLRPAD